MDLLGDIGHEDQLTAVRTENAVLQKRVKELAAQVKILTVEKAALQAEVEIYRAADQGNATAAAAATTGTTSSSTAPAVVDHPFVQSGNGVYCSQPDVVMNDLHNGCNPLCVALHERGTLLASGGADRSLVVTQWGAATEAGVVPARNTARWSANAPVIAVAWAPPLASSILMVAAGCMDGTVQLLQVDTIAQQLTTTPVTAAPRTHGKFCKHVVWCGATLLATAAADGDVHLYSVTVDTMMAETPSITLEHVTSFHLGGAIESAVWVADCSSLVVYTRETTFLHIFHLNDDNFQNNEVPRSTLPLNDPTNNCASDQHVSFAVLAMAVHGEYIACATDSNRHLILHVPSHRIVRNLYGHDADAYSSPVLAWSASGQYLYCNTQHAAALVVYELAGGHVVEEEPNRDQPHQRPIKDIYSSPTSDLVVTTSYDRKIIVWCTAS